MWQNSAITLLVCLYLPWCAALSGASSSEDSSAAAWSTSNKIPSSSSSSPPPSIDVEPEEATRHAPSPPPPPRPVLYALQRPHPCHTPAEIFQSLAESSHQLGIHELDVYGDWDQDASTSFLRRFEREMLLGLTTTTTEEGSASMGENPRRGTMLQDAVFMPSGVVAQSIALLVHHHNKTRIGPLPAPPLEHPCFACHHTSHLLLHEEHAYRELLGLDVVVLTTMPEPSTGTLHVPPLTYDTIRTQLSDKPPPPGLSTLLLELPHRELGGKVTPFTDILQMRDYCRIHNVRFHCDGARLFEATAAYPHLSISELVAPFDSVYVSCYKGLGGLSGAVLLGSLDFCAQARIWLRRFGGNLYTLLPYALSGYIGFHRQWKDLQKGSPRPDGSETRTPTRLSFAEKKDKLVAIVQALSMDPSVASIVTFDPPVPEVNMVHGYLRCTPEQCQKALDAVQDRTGLQVLVRVRPVIPIREPAHSLGYQSYFEWTMGEYNGNIPNERFLEGWTALAQELNAATSPDR